MFWSRLRYPAPILSYPHCIAIFALAAIGLWPAPLLASALPHQDESFALELDSGRRLQVTLRKPLEAAGELPALIVFGGFQHAAEVLDFVPLDREMALVTFDYPFDAPRKFMFPDSLSYLPQFEKAVHEMFEGIARLRPVLAARPDIDAKRITIAGASAGAPFATIGGARGNYPGILIVQGFGDLPQVIARQLELRWVPKYGRWTRWPARAIAAFAVWLLDLPAPEQAARQFEAGQKVLMLNAADDHRIPAEASALLWHAVSATPALTERVIMPGGHLDGRDDENIPKILRQCMQWMEAQGLIPAAAAVSQ